MTVSIIIPGDTGFGSSGSSGGGDVVGPASSINNQVVLFSGTTGKLLKAAPGSFVGTSGQMSVSSSSVVDPALTVDATTYILNGLIQDWRASGTSVAMLYSNGLLTASAFTMNNNASSYTSDAFLNSTGKIRWSTGSFYYDTTDLQLARSAAKTLTLDDGAAGPVSFSVVGNSGLGAAAVATAFAIFGASTTAEASFNLPTGAAPTSPVDGDVWREDNTNLGLKIRINGVTKTIVVA